MVILGPHAQPHPIFHAKQTTQPGTGVPHGSPNPKSSCLPTFIHRTGKYLWMIVNPKATLGITPCLLLQFPVEPAVCVAGDNE